MDGTKKRKLDEADILQLNATPFEESQFKDQQTSSITSVEELRSLLEPLSKTHLVNLLATVSIAEEIKSLARADPALRKLFVRGLAWTTTSETLCADMESAQNALKAPSKMIDVSSSFFMLNPST
ncbi:hypothetical protein LIER_15210 [Lithospermum erythrorhizon]|uniref:Uncharacterized protein n=1 Tax=Lithospermum erythrorhizon TaxID=34254 RepID=A0AAV3Q3L2_LITER